MGQDGGCGWLGEGGYDGVSAEGSLYNRDKAGAWQFYADDFEPVRKDDEHLVGGGGNDIHSDAVESESEATSESYNESSNSDPKDLSEGELWSDADDREGKESDNEDE